MNIKELSLNGSATYKPNEYLYNGKMMQDEMGLGWLDYGARFYDPVLGRWHSVDPLAQSRYYQSPYLFCSNNPILRIDIFGMQDTVSLPPVTIVGQRPAPTLNTADLSMFFNSLPKKQNVSILPEPAPYVAVRDNTEVAGHFLEAAALAHKLTGAKLGSNLGIYGANFFGNSSVKILKLAKPIKIGGVMVSMIVLTADAMNAYGNGLQGDDQDAAVEQLVKDIVTTGVYAISAEAGILITVGDYICNSPEMQQFQQDLRMEKDRKNGIWQINTGPSYVSPK
jgi:RHS repeat-associated protein